MTHGRGAGNRSLRPLGLLLFETFRSEAEARGLVVLSGRARYNASVSRALLVASHLLLRFFHPPAGVCPAQKKARCPMQVYEVRNLVNELSVQCELLTALDNEVTSQIKALVNASTESEARP